MKKENERNYRKSFPLKARFDYWFDNRMAKGSLGLIRALIVVTIMFAALMGFLVYLNNNDKGAVPAVWESIKTIISPEMPDYETSGFYLLIMSITALAGLLFASVLIGIITSAIEEKIDSLKQGNSLVLEKEHIVVLGFYPGEYTLLHQLILAAAGKPACVVIVEDMERSEMEQSIKENLSKFKKEELKNFRIVCRTADITDPASLEKCSVETCKTIIVSPTDDKRTTKAILAVSALLDEKKVPEKSVNAIISKEIYRFPPSLAEANHISTLPTNSILAKMIAHSCTQTGLSEAFREVFNFEGSEFYLISLYECDGMTFAELMIRLNDAVPAGVFRNDEIFLNPPADFQILDSDRILVFSETENSAKLEKEAPEPQIDDEPILLDAEDSADIVIIGHNETLPTILQELPENVSHVFLVEQDTTEKERKKLQQIADSRDLLLQYHKCDPQTEEGLLELAEMTNHFVILNDHDKDPEEADMEVIFLLLNLREIRKRYDYCFNITVEMQKEHNQKLVGGSDHTDFLVSSSMSSLILAQLAESPELINVFREILSNKGNELYLKNIGLCGHYTVRSLRRILLNQGYIFLGYLDKENNSKFNPPIDELVELAKDNRIIVLGRN